MLKQQRLLLIILVMCNLFLLLIITAKNTNLLTTSISVLCLGLSALYLYLFVGRNSNSYEVLGLLFSAFIVSCAYFYFMLVNQWYLIVLVVLSIIGFIMATQNIAPKRYKQTIIRKKTLLEQELPYSDICETPRVIIEDLKEIKTTKYIPGKFVGSITGNKYHLPKCDWAKQIQKKNQVWFNSSSDADKQGYSAHNCTIS